MVTFDFSGSCFYFQLAFYFRFIFMSCSIFLMKTLVVYFIAVFLVFFLKSLFFSVMNKITHCHRMGYQKIYTAAVTCIEESTKSILLISFFCLASSTSEDDTSIFVFFWDSRTCIRKQLR